MRACTRIGPFCWLFLAWAGSSAAEFMTGDWPEFRGPSGQGISSATDVPIRWSAGTNVAWKTRIPGSGWSSPVLAGGRLYVTTAVIADESSNASLRALCLGADDGRILWDVEVLTAAPAKTRSVHKKNSLASPTPIVRDNRVYVHFGHMGTAALDLEGNVIWQQTSIEYSPVHGNGGSPAVVDDLLVFSCDGSEQPFLVALDRATGEVRWKTSRDTPASKTFSFSTPLVVETNGAKQIVSPTSGLVAGYEPRNGRELWRVRYGEGYSVIPRPVLSDGLLFVCSGFDKPSLFAIRPTDGGGNLTDTHVVWRHSKGVPNTPSPIAAGGNVYFVSDSGVASCLDARTGEVHWNERLGGAFSASPVLAEKRLYFLNEEGVCYVVRTDRQFELLATNDLGERTFASPAVTDGALFLRSESQLWRIGSATR